MNIVLNVNNKIIIIKDVNRIKQPFCLLSIFIECYLKYFIKVCENFDIFVSTWNVWNLLNQYEYNYQTHIRLYCI